MEQSLENQSNTLGMEDQTQRPPNARVERRKKL